MNESASGKTAQRKMGRAALLLATSAGAGHLLTLALTPFLARIYEPVTFGTFAGIVAVGAVFVGVSTLRLELLAVSSPDENEANELLGAGLIATLVISAVVGAGTAIACLAVDVSWQYMLVPAVIVTASFQLLGRSVILRDLRYAALGKLQFAQAAGVPTAQLGLGFVTPSAFMLVLGFLLPRFLWLRSLQALRKPTRAVWVSSRRFASQAGPSALVNSFSSQVAIILTSVLYGAYEVALLAIAIRLVVGPLTVISESTAAAAVGEVGSMLRSATGSPVRLVRRAMLTLACIGVVPATLVGAFAPAFAGIYLGSQWEQAGWTMALLVPGALAQFIAAPFAQCIHLAGRPAWLLNWDCGRLILFVTAIVVTNKLGGSFNEAIAVYSGAMVATYLVLGWLVIRALSKSLDEQVMEDLADV